MNFKQQQVENIFTKFGKELFGVWFSGEKRKGERKSWYISGQLHEHSFYLNNKLHSERKEWWGNGQIWEHSFWKNGRRDGRYKTWDENGQLIIHSIYKNGEIIRDLI